jgi:hypothetical protein
VGEQDESLSDQVKEYLVMINLSDPHARGLFILFLSLWGLGLLHRILFRPSKWMVLSNEVDLESMSDHAQVRVSGFLRWLFGYWPVTGPISMVGATYQLTAFLTVGVSAVFAWISPDVFRIHYDWLVLIILGTVYILATFFMRTLWKKQSNKR